VAKAAGRLFERPMLIEMKVFFYNRSASCVLYSKSLTLSLHPLKP
jgi:hypothetical protein